MALPDKDAGASAGSSAVGSVISKVMLVPSPSSLTAVSEPPIMSESRLQMDRPRPVPGRRTFLSVSTW